MARIITVTSGKGGVGKTSISLNLALELAREGHRVCLFDADLGLANINILTGIYPKKNLEDVITGKSSLTDILIRDYQGIDLIPGSTGVEMIASLSPMQSEALFSSFKELDDYDYFIFDTSAGISSQVLSFCMASHEIILVVTEEPTSMTDAYSLLKVLNKKGFQKTVRVIVNQVRNKKSAQTVYRQLKDTVLRFMKMEIMPLGLVIEDSHVQMAVVAQTPFCLLFPDAPGSRSIRFIAKKLANCSQDKDLSLDAFWRQCISFLLDQAPPPSKAITNISDISPGDIHALLKKIEEGISALSAELNTVRELLTQQEPMAPSSSSTTLPRTVTLDFESWLIFRVDNDTRQLN